MLAPLSSEAVGAKYRALTDGIVADDRRARIEELVLGIAGLPSLHPLITELAAPAEAVFGGS